MSLVSLRKITCCSLAVIALLFCGMDSTEAATGAETWLVEFRVHLSRSPVPAEREGKFVVEVHPKWAPLGAKRFRELVDSNFFRGNRFFRVMDKFVAQFGISGEPHVAASWIDKMIPDDPDAIGSQGHYNTRGTLSFATKVGSVKYGPLAGKPDKNQKHVMAMLKLKGEGSRSTQMFINLVDNAHFNNMGLVPFAVVKSGMDVVDRLYSGYGETSAGKGTGKGPDPARITAEGDPYLAGWPDLSHVISTRVLESPSSADPPKQEL